MLTSPCSTFILSDIQTFIMDCRVTPMRFAYESSESIIQFGRSTFTRRCPKLGRCAFLVSRNSEMSSPSSKRRSSSLAVIVDSFFAISCPSTGYDSNFSFSSREYRSPKHARMSGDQGLARFGFASGWQLKSGDILPKFLCLSLPRES